MHPQFPFSLRTKVLQFILIFLFLFIGQKLKAQTLKQDSLALVDLYNSANGANWFNKDGWLKDPVSTWGGITVTNGRVTEVYFGANNLVGTIPTSIGNLSELTDLQLGANQLSGVIPDEFYKLTKLQWLDLGYNQLSGTISSSIGNMTALTFLLLGNNQLSGIIPTEFGKLTALTQLSVVNNQLSGTIPTELSGLTALVFLGLANNQLNGEIPVELGSLTSLISLELSYNQLNGTIPTELSNLTVLRYLELNNNQLSGSIPAELGKLINLEDLELNNNQLGGSIPVELGNLTALNYLILNNNQLNGSVPAEIGNLIKLQGLQLNNNQLSGTIPTSVNNLAALAWLKLNDNQLTFAGMENVVQTFNSRLGNKLIYSPQAELEIQQQSSIIKTLYISAGGTLANNTYTWYKNGEVITTNKGDSTFVVPSDGNYYVTVSNSVAAALTLYSDTVNVTVTGIEPNYHLSVYPNPTKTVLNIDIGQSQEIVEMPFTIFNMLGQRVNSGSINSLASNQIDVHQLASGIYVLELQQNNGQSKSYKIIIEH